jgi:hypothetical protein
MRYSHVHKWRYGTRYWMKEERKKEIKEEITPAEERNTDWWLQVRAYNVDVRDCITKYSKALNIQSV